MPVPPSRRPLPVASTVALVPGGLRRTLPLPKTPAAPPTTQTSFVVAADAQPFTVGAHQTVVVTFPGIPKRTLGGSTLRQQGGTIAMTSSDTLHFAVMLQNVSGAMPTVAGRVIDTRGLRITAAVLPGNNTYAQFQAVITAGAQGASGLVSGALTLMRN